MFRLAARCFVMLFYPLVGGSDSVTRSRWLWASLGLGGVLLAGMAAASETKTYSYDALGRLTASAIAGGPNDTRRIATCFDRAGNRLRYDVATSAPATCPTPTPTPAPSP